MAFSNDPIFTDEELCRELAKLGYSDVPEDLFNAMKKDLLALADETCTASDLPQKAPASFRKQNNSKSPEKILAREISNTLSSPESVISPRSFLEFKNRYKLYKYRREQKLLTSASSASNSDTSTNSESKIKRKVLRRINGKSIITEELLDIPGVFNTSYPDSEEQNSSLKISKSSDDSLNIHIKPNSETYPKSMLISKKNFSYDCGDNTKQSVVQRINKNACSYRENHAISKISHQKPLNSSPNSSVSISPNSSNDSSPSNHQATLGDSSTESSSTSLTLSDSTKSNSTSLNSTHSPIHRKKKNDPVAMYNYYKKFWNNFKPPGEKTHDKLRWAVRDKMLEYSL